MGTEAKQAGKMPSLLVILSTIALPFAIFWDRTAMSLSMPAMAKDFGLPTEQFQSVTTLFLVVILATILFFGRLGDVLGKGRVYLAGAAVFALGSLVCALSPNIQVLYIGSILEGLGSGASFATSQGILTEVSPPDKRGRMLSIFTTAAAAGMILSTAIGGDMVSAFGWRSIFVVDLVLAVFTLVVGIICLPKGTRSKSKVDYLGASVLAVSIFIFFQALFDSGKYGFHNPYVIAGLLGGILLIAVFIFIEIKSKEPLLDLSLYKKKVFSFSLVCVTARYIVTSCIYIFLPLYLQDLRGLSQEQSGLAILILPVALALTSPLSGVLSDKISPAIVSFIGLLVMTVGTSIFLFISPTTPIWMAIVMLGIIGVGSGLFSPANSSTLMGSAPSDKLGVASSANGFAKNLGTALGVALLPRLLYGIMGSEMGHKVTGYVQGKPLVFIDALHKVYALCFILLLISIIFSILCIVSSKKQTKEKTA